MFVRNICAAPVPGPRMMKEKKLGVPGVLLTFLTYNIRHCRGLDNRVSLAAVARTIAQTGADTTGLQEVDCFNPRSCFMDQARWLGRELGLFYVFGPARSWFKLARFGNAVLSRHPVLGQKNYQLPGGGEKRSLLRTELLAGGLRYAFYTTHLGLDARDRLRQVEQIIAITGADELPLVLAGDFNASPGAPELRGLFHYLSPADPAGEFPTFPAGEPRYKIDYIFYSPHWKLEGLRVYRSRASDHLPLAVHLRLA